MHSRTAPLLLVLTCIAVTAVGWIPAVVTAQGSGGQFVLRKQVIAAGGTRSIGSSIVVASTTGQTHAAQMNGGPYRVTAGFHGPQPTGSADPIFGNGFEQN